MCQRGVHFDVPVAVHHPPPMSAASRGVLIDHKIVLAICTNPGNNFTAVHPTWHFNLIQVGTQVGAQVGTKLGYREPPYSRNLENMLYLVGGGARSARSTKKKVNVGSFFHVAPPPRVDYRKTNSRFLGRQVFINCHLHHIFNRSSFMSTIWNAA